MSRNNRPEVLLRYGPKLNAFYKTKQLMTAGPVTHEDEKSNPFLGGVENIEKKTGDKIAGAPRRVEIVFS